MIRRDDIFSDSDLGILEKNPRVALEKSNLRTSDYVLSSDALALSNRRPVGGHSTRSLNYVPAHSSDSEP